MYFQPKPYTFPTQNQHVFNAKFLSTCFQHKQSYYQRKSYTNVFSIQNNDAATAFHRGRASPDGDASIARNSLVAAEDIKKSQKFTIKNIIAKRPGTGISPMHLFKVIGKKAKKNFVRDELIKI